MCKHIGTVWICVAEWYFAGTSLIFHSDCYFCWVLRIDHIAVWLSHIWVRMFVCMCKHYEVLPDYHFFAFIVLFLCCKLSGLIWGSCSISSCSLMGMLENVRRHFVYGGTYVAELVWLCMVCLSVAACHGYSMGYKPCTSAAVSWLISFVCCLVQRKILVSFSKQSNSYFL